MNYKEDSFLIRTYTKAELAHLYNPHVCLKVALQILRRWIIYNSLSCTNSNRKVTAHATASFRRNKWQLSYTFWANRSNLLPFYTKFLYTFPQRSSFALTKNN